MLHTQLSDWKLCHPTTRLECYFNCPEIGWTICPEETVNKNMDAKENSGCSRGFASEEELKVVDYFQSI